MTTTIDPIVRDLIVGLLLWSFLSMGTGLAGLYARPSDFWRAFWFMGGLWGLIDGLIAASGLVVGPATMAGLRDLLRFNAGLDLLYIAAGLYLLRRKTPEGRGFGAAVVAQGIFLVLFDGVFWWRVARTLA